MKTKISSFILCSLLCVFIGTSIPGCPKDPKQERYDACGSQPTLTACYECVTQADSDCEEFDCNYVPACYAECLEIGTDTTENICQSLPDITP